MDSSIFVVDEEPYCIWEIDMAERNSEFLSSIDTEYFDYLLQTHIKTEDEKRASVALQLAYHHSLETMFSYLCAYMQAPECVYAWVDKCKNIQLRNVINKISCSDSMLYSRLQTKPISWKVIAEAIFDRYEPDTEKQKETIELFSTLWSRLANIYTDKNHTDEYNSMKHGFRVSPGGFGLSVGLEHEYGVAPPESEMNTIGHSDYGVTFLELEVIGKIKGNRSLKSRRKSINWQMEKTIMLIQLISMSIKNIVGALKIANNHKASTIRFFRPEESNFFENAWGYSSGVNNFSMDYVFDEEMAVKTTRSGLLNLIKEHES